MLADFCAVISCALENFKLSVQCYWVDNTKTQHSTNNPNGVGHTIPLVKYQKPKDEWNILGCGWIETFFNSSSIYDI